MLRKLLVMAGIAFVLTAAQTAVAGPTDSQKCSATMRKCIGKLFAGIMKCHAKASLTPADTTDQACMNKENGKYDGCASKALGKGGCNLDQTGVDHIKNDDIAVWTEDMKGDSAP